MAAASPPGAATTSRLWLSITLRAPSMASSCAALTSTVLRALAFQSAAVNFSTAASSQVLPLSIDTCTEPAPWGPPTSPMLRFARRESEDDESAADTVR